jgi:hypothetical protein
VTILIAPGVSPTHPLDRGKIFAQAGKEGAPRQCVGIHDARRSRASHYSPLDRRSGWERRAGEVNRKADQIRAAWEAGDLQWQIRKWHQRELGIKTAN